MVQLRNRDLKGITGFRTGVGIHVGGDRTVTEPTDRGDEMIGVHRGFPAALNNSLLDHFDGVFGQQLQDPNVLPRPGGGTLAILEVRPQLVEASRQFPSGKHEGMIQGRRPATENRQIVTRLHDPFPSGVAAVVMGHPPLAGHHLDPIHIRLDRHRPEGPATRNTIAVRIEPHRLILIHLRHLRDKRIERTRRQGQSRLLVLLKELPDGLRLARHPVVPLGHRARPQVGIQLGQVLHAGNRSRPVPLQIVYAVFHVGLLVAPRRHAEPRIKPIMTGQGRVPRLQPTPPAPQDRRGHRLGIIPPDLPGHTTEERKALDHARQNRLRLFARQRQRKTKARVTPRQQQHGHLPAAIREIDVDVAEVCFQAPARRMRQGNERLSLVAEALADISSHLVIAARVAVLIPQTTIELRRRVLLLRGGLPIVGQDLLDQGLVGTQSRGRPILLQAVRPRLTLLQDLPDLTPGVTKPPGNLPNAHPIAMCDADLTIIFHRQHPFFSVKLGASSKALSLRSSLRWVHFRCRFLLAEVGPFYMPISKRAFRI